MISPAEVHDRILKTGQKWADAQDDAERADEKRKAIFASLVVSFSDDNPISKSEHMARREASYQDAVTKYQIAAHRANLARAEMNAARCWFEAVRSAESTARAEINLK